MAAGAGRRLNARAEVVPNDHCQTLGLGTAYDPLRAFAGSGSERRE